MDIQQLKNRLIARSRQYGPALMMALVVGATGVFIMQESSAATFVVASESEAGDQSGNAEVLTGQSGASGSGTVRFNTAVTPTPTPTPTPPTPPSGPGTQSCPAYPAFPDANCTGVPAGVSLTTVNDDVIITTAGTVYDARNVRGKIYVEANNVTIKRTYAEGGIRLFDEFSNLVVEDSELGPATGSGGDDGIAFENYTCRRCDIHNFSDGGKLSTAVLIEDTWIHDLYSKPEDHNDGLQSNGGGSTTIRHSRIDSRPSNISDSGNAALFFADHPSGTMLIEENLLIGGVYTLQLRDIASYTATVRNNQFVRGSYTYGTHVIADGDAGRVTWLNNTFSDNGQAIAK